MDDMEFSDPTSVVIRNMRAMRKSRGWTAQQLAEQLTAAGRPTSRGVIANMESGRAETMTVEFLFALAYVFETDPATLTTAQCDRCGGQPPAGYACLSCGRESVAA